MPEFQFQEMFPHGEDTTPYRKLSADHVGTAKFGGRDVLTVEPEALTLLTAAAFHDISHLLRPGHLAQLASILDDPEASSNDSSPITRSQYWCWSTIVISSGYLARR